MVNNSQDDSDSYSPSNSSESSSSAACATSSSASFSSDSETSAINVSKQACKQDGNAVKTSSSEKGPTNQILEKEHIDHILEVHKKCPPLHKPGEKESKVPATQETIDYFLKAFMLKRGKFHKILACREIPKVLKTVPFALSYQSFVLSYWPGPVQCCNKTFGSTRFFCKHLYDSHLPPSAPPSLTCSASGMGSQAAPNTPSSNPLGNQTTPEQSLPPPQAKSTPVEDENENAIEKNSSVSADEAKGSPLKDQTKSLPPTSTGKSIKDYFDKKNDQTSTKKSPGPKQNTRPSTSSAGPEVASSNSSLSASRRRPLSPSAKPSPLSVKLQRLNSGSPRKNRELASLSDCNGLHSASDTSMDADNDTDQACGTARTRARPKRMCNSKRDLNDSATDLGVDPQVMDELKKDQKIYQPQHEPGQSENFVANESRLKYFTDVLKLKLNKYGQLTTRRPRSPSHRIPLALPLGGFIRFYWPGKMTCCGQVHENSVSLEEHISRQHKPPRPFPEFLLVSEDDDDEDGIESDATDCLLPADYPSVGKHSMEVTTPNRNASPAEKKGKYPDGFLDDQNNFLPQHKIGDPEDFLANQESISYFMEVYNLKMDKYAHITSSRKKPLGGTFSFFSHLYWPGMVNCCGVVCDSVGTFQSHFIKCHAPPSRTAPKLSVLTSPPKRSLPEVVRTTPRGSTVSRSIISPSGRSSSLAVPDGGNKSADCSTPVRQLQNIEEEIRQIRRQMADATSLNKVLQLLEEVLLNALNVFERMKSVTDRSDRCMCVECLDSAWCVSKTGIVRWRDLKDSKDEFLNPVQYVYTTAPLFINWDSQDHLTQMENIMRLAYAAVRHVKSTLSQKREVSPVLNSKSDVTDTTEKRATPKVHLMDNISKVVETVPKIDAESSTNDKKGSHMTVKEFCERVNVALSQNTNARRDTGFKDDKGFYHPIYRYHNISLMIKLYAPTSMTSLRCCNRVFSLQGIKTHVIKVHEGPNPKYPISLAPA